MKYIFAIALLSFLFSCGPKRSTPEQIIQDSAFAKKGSFAYDLEFLQKYKSVIVLGEAANPAKVLIVNDFQARVMTSTAVGNEGESFGWINYKLIESGARQPHINDVGGEDFFWLGPEGGSYSIFFKKNKPLTFENWQTPSLIDSGAFDLVSVSATEASFKRSGIVTNNKGYTFQVDITRQINLLNEATIFNIFGISTQNLNAVAFQTTNFITNTSIEDWSKKNGLLSIGIMGMFNPSEKATIILPHGHSLPTLKKITPDYLGKIPPERILEKENALILKADGRFRGKIGLSPLVAKDIIGSYDSEKHTLTLIKFDLEKDGDYVNSKWEDQKDHFNGDAVNAYNDGPTTDNKVGGSFYELETSSPAKQLKSHQSITHRHITIHLVGEERFLDVIAKQTLGISLQEINELP